MSECYVVYVCERLAVTSFGKATLVTHADTLQGQIQRDSRGGVQLNTTPAPTPLHPTPLDSKFHLQGKFWINLINLGYRIYPKYSHPLLFILVCQSSAATSFGSC